MFGRNSSRPRHEFSFWHVRQCGNDYLWGDNVAGPYKRVLAINSSQLLTVKHWHPAVSLHIARHVKLRAELVQPKS